jgi:hypothetical protein
MRKVIPFPLRSPPRLVEPAAAEAPPPDPTSVTFTRPFMLPGMDEPHSAGTFELRTTRHELDVPWAAYRKTNRLMLPNGSAIEALEVTSDDLEAALALDGKSGADGS